MTDFTISEEAVEAACVASIEISGFDATRWPKEYPNPEQLRKIMRKGIAAALPVMFERVGFVYTMQACGDGAEVKYHALINLPLPVGTTVYAIKEPK